jgi:hypothetical protein
MRLHLRPLGVIQNESVHPKLESQPSPDENPESQQALEQKPAHALFDRGGTRIAAPFQRGICSE